MQRPCTYHKAAYRLTDRYEFIIVGQTPSLCVYTAYSIQQKLLGLPDYVIIRWMHFIRRHY